MYCQVKFSICFPKVFISRIYAGILISIHKNYNNLFDNKAYSLNAKTHFPIISSNDLDNFRRTDE